MLVEKSLFLLLLHVGISFLWSDVKTFFEGDNNFVGKKT